jgi:hypothetical protein
MAQIIHDYSINTIDETLKNEITTLYYLSLNEPYTFRTMLSYYLRNKNQRT